MVVDPKDVSVEKEEVVWERWAKRQAFVHELEPAPQGLDELRLPPAD